MFTPRQKKIVLALLVILAVSTVKLAQELQKLKKDRERQEEDAKWYSDRYKNLDMYGTSYDPESPLGQSLKEYYRSEEEKKLRDQQNKDENTPDSAGDSNKPAVGPPGPDPAGN